MIDLTIATAVAADTFHQAATLTAKKFSGQNVIGFWLMLGFKLAIYLQHGLCPFPKVCIDDGRDRALDADIISAAGINAPIHFILDDAGDTAFIKGVALACAFTLQH